MKKQLEIKIPFSGFYETIYGDYFNIEIEHYNAVEAYPTANDETIQQTIEAVFDTVNHRASQLNIARQYIENFNQRYRTNLEFKELTSPLEYNFETDKIFCKISVDEMRAIYKATNKKELAAYVQQKHSSRSGFASFYSSDLNEWIMQGFVNLDYNQLGTILECWLVQEHLNLKEHVYITNAIDYDVADACSISEQVEFNE